VHPGPNRQPDCVFCDGTGLWADPDGDPAVTDPCPLCDGTGAFAPPTAPAGDEPHAVDTIGRLLSVLPRLTDAERQRLYEELYALYNCRIYRD
jgi:hypothetical protein